MPVRASSLPVDALLKEGTSESVRGRARAWPRTARVEGALAGGAPSPRPRARRGAARREADSGRRPGVYSRRIAVGLRDGFSALEAAARSAGSRARPADHENASRRTTRRGGVRLREALGPEPGRRVPRAPCHGAPPASSPPRRPSGPFSIRAGQDASTRRRGEARPCAVNVRGCRRVPRRASRVDRASTWCFAARGRLPPSSTAPETQRAYARAASGLGGGSGPILDGAKAAQRPDLRCKARTLWRLQQR